MFSLTKTVAQTAPLIYGFYKDQSGLIQELDWEALSQPLEQYTGEWCWLHLNRESEEAQNWLRANTALDMATCNVLLQSDSRPRIAKHLNGYLINLRGVNLNPGQEPEDMISLRMWATPQLIVTTRARHILAAEDLRELILSSNPPSSIGGMVSYLAQRLVTRIGPVVSDLDEAVDTLEDQVLDAGSTISRASIRGFRRTALSLRRYLAPQREALAGFLLDSQSFLTIEDKHQLRETHDVVVRVAEDLDLIRERAMLLHEQLVEERAEAMNSRLFILAIVSAIFLPLSFITGLFGVNIGGMPGVDNEHAFAIFCGAVGLFSLFIILVFWKMKWI